MYRVLVKLNNKMILIRPIIKLLFIKSNLNKIFVFMLQYL